MESQAQCSETSLSKAMDSLMQRIQTTLKSLVKQESDSLYLSINMLLETWMEFTRGIFTDGNAQANAQLSYWQDFLLLCKDLNWRLTTSGGLEGEGRDKVLNHFIEKYYFLLSQHVVLTIKGLFTANDEENHEQVSYHSAHFLHLLESHRTVVSH